MTPHTAQTAHTVHRIAQEIRQQRMSLTTEETWWQRQPASDTRAEAYRRIVFWRRVLKDAEKRLATETGLDVETTGLQATA